MSLEADPLVSVKSPETADLANSSIMSSLETWFRSEQNQLSHSRIPNPQKLCDIILGSPKNSFGFFHKEEVSIWKELNKLFGQPNTCTLFYASKCWNNLLCRGKIMACLITQLFFFVCLFFVKQLDYRLSLLISPTLYLSKCGSCGPP